MSQSDVIIAGAGIVGLATALKILEFKPGTKVLILEKEPGEARHQTGNNSGVIHSGIYYKPGSLKAQNCITGYDQLLNFCNKHNVKYDICGKVIVAINETELPRLQSIYERGIANGLDKIRYISKDELKEIEPHAYGIKAIHVPYTGIIDYKEVSRKYAELIRAAGGEIKFNEKVFNLNDTGSRIEVTTQNSSFNTKIFINCCGLQSDEVAGLSEKKIDTRIIPFRGEYYKIKPERSYLVKNLIYPVPDPAFPFLGVHFTRMTNGEVEAGPNAVLSFKKEGYKKTSFGLKDSFKTFTWKGFYSIASKYYKTGFGEFKRSFSKKAFVKALQKLMPEITADDLIPGGAGVRAQAISIDGRLIDDFLIHDSGRIVNVLNAPSPAATSSLAIGQTIAEKIINKL
ncbi:MAG: L-2-hydroxyglutarate oxidase [Ignavibacteria bacterium]|nr:L-2-hydroxyglutarate oxidase [Ignavibacteria bacterium]